MQPLQKYSIRRKLAFIGLLTTVVALVLSGIVMSAYEFTTFRRSLVHDLTAQARIIGSNLTAALTFNDPKTAEEILSALEASPNIDLAVVYTKQGEVFSTYRRSGLEKNVIPSFPLQEGYRFIRDHILLSQHILVNNTYVGSIYIQSDLTELYDRLMRYALTLLGVIVTSSAVAILLFTRLQNTITSPIFHLLKIMGTISKDKNYSIRADVRSQDEIGLLSGGFNSMLTEIEKRDDELEHHRQQLQELVGKRTAKLESINTQLQLELGVRKKAEEQIMHIAYHDTVTKLPNRYLFKDRLQQAIASAAQYKELFAILFLDLDNFKRVNDTFGHDTGDLLLGDVAERIEKYLRKSDSIAYLGTFENNNTLARFGGDEFTILLTKINDSAAAAKVARRIVSMFDAAFKIGTQEVFITTSIGISLYPTDGQDAETLLKNADTAMYHSKDHGKNQYQFYAESMNAVAHERFIMESDLRKGLAHSEFRLYYQPQIDTESGKMFGVEALIRWMHPEKGLLLPTEFIPLAEETGLILPIGEWVLETACRQNKEWQTSGFAPLLMTINVSGIQFMQKKFIESVARALHNSGLDPRYLVLEFTESVLIEATEHTVETLRELKAMGLHLSLDDFGTGYSSLSYLKRFPIDTLKIDHSFIRDILTDHDNTAIVKAIVAMAHSLSLKTIAEGVETVEQMGFLRGQEIRGMQGHLFSPSLPSDALTLLLKNEKKVNNWETFFPAID